MKMVAVILIISVLFSMGASADSIWNDKLGSPYTTQKARGVGDIVTIIILETTLATQKSGTDTSIKDELSAKFTHTIDRLSRFIGPSNEMAGLGKNVYKGLGATERSSKVQAKVSAHVVDILSNGNLKIAGSHKVEVNDEVQEIQISGLIRPKDISIANTVYSYQVADASISIKGKGAVGEASSPGWITRILNWIF